MSKWMDVRPCPQDELSQFAWWQNCWRAQLIPNLTISKRIEIK